uniref:Zinc finger protein 142 n=1 Tax=Callorhinchus milii TaxID=7868 RepID=A0A4W3I0P4_CALMI
VRHRAPAQCQKQTLPAAALQRCVIVGIGAVSGDPGTEGMEHLYKTHICPECKRCFKKRTHLVEHLHLHFPDPSLQCPHCTRFFTSKGKLKVHLLRELGEKAHSCPLCEYRAVERNSLSRHMASMHENTTNFYSDVYSCPVCEQHFTVSNLLKEHMKVHRERPKRLVCFQQSCPFTSEDRGELQRHVRAAHGVQAVECRYRACAALFGSAAEMETHRRTHYAFHCDQCDFVCSNKHAFRRHRRRGHPGSEELHCAFCPFLTFNPVEFTDHVGKMHANEKIHKCSECSFATAHKRVLNRHFLLHTGEKPHKCEVCDFTCRDVGYLSKHMLTHSDTKNYMCTECGYITKWKHYLTVHMRKHTGDLRYHCNQCSYRCHRADQLSSHKLRHQGKSLICEVCGFACKRKYELQKHMQVKHCQDYQVPVYQCQYCSYQTPYKQALLNHENCKHTQHRAFRCALCAYSTFSNTSLFFHKRKVHGYVPGDKAWLDNYARQELAMNSSDLLLGYSPTGHSTGLVSTRLPALGTWEACEAEAGTMYTHFIPGPCTGDASQERNLTENFDGGNGDLPEGQEVTEVTGLAQLEVTEVTGLAQLEVTEVTGLAQAEVTEVTGLAQLEITELAQSEIMEVAEVSRVEVTEVMELVQTEVTELMGLAQAEVTELAQSEVTEVTELAGSEVTEVSVLAQECEIKALRKQDRQRAQALVLEGRVQMLVIQTDTQVFKCENCSYVTRKEKAMIFHSKSGCQGRRGALVCSGCGANFKQQRGLSTHQRKKCPLVIKSRKLYVRQAAASQPSVRPEPELTPQPEPGTHSPHHLRGKKAWRDQPGERATTESKEQSPAVQRECEGLAGETARCVTPEGTQAEEPAGGREPGSEPQRGCQVGYSREEGRFRCDGCEFVCDSEADMQRHEEACGRPAPRVQCRSCQLEGEGKVSEAEGVVKRRRLSCPSCPFSCSQARALATHRRKGCLRADELQCGLCSFVCKSPSALRHHGRLHRGKGSRRPALRCQLCLFTCKLTRCLQQHVAIKHQGLKPYKCRYCGFSTARRYRLDAHESLHTGRGRLGCDSCQQTFGTGSKLRIHKLRVHEKRPTHFCPLCDYSAYNQNDIRRHNASCHSGELSLPCRHCEASFSSEGALKQHCLRQHQEPARHCCSSCPFVCRSEATLKSHEQKQHPQLQCGTCKAGFGSRKALESHRHVHYSHRCEHCPFATRDRQQLIQHLLDSHEGGRHCRHQLVYEQHVRGHGGTRLYKCTDCDYTTRNRQKITWHSRIHTGEKPYKCRVCSYACADPSRLKYHMRIHQDERKYLCPECGYKCKWINQLKYHMTKHTGAKPYRCDECEYCTNRADALRTHKETRHREARGYICEQCGKGFKTRFLLKTHLKKHSEEKPYVCGVCYRGFRWQAGLRHHHLTHTNQHPFYCHYCPYTAKQKFQVVKHIQRHHPLKAAEDPSQGVGKVQVTHPMALSLTQAQGSGLGESRVMESRKEPELSTATGS